MSPPGPAAAVLARHAEPVHISANPRDTPLLEVLMSTENVPAATHAAGVAHDTPFKYEEEVPLSGVVVDVEVNR